MAADSPTPGTETHRMLAGSHERPGGPECRCGAPWDRWNDRCTRPAAPSPVDTTEPPAEGRIDWSQHRGSCRIFYAERRCTCIGTEPPAETQQDDERDRYGHTEADHEAAGACQRPTMDARVAASATEYPRGSDLAVAFERGWDAHRQQIKAIVDRMAGR